MIGDEERREVARRLRAIEPDDFSSYSEEHECVEKALGIWDDFDKFLWHVVADLIETGVERTCSMDVTDADYGLYAVLECSECGRSCEEVNGCYRYCPHCGAKVVDDD